MKMILENWQVIINKKELIKPLHVELKSGEFNALVGPNGAGKSTLLRSLMKFDCKFNGKFYLNSIAIHEATFENISKNIAYMAQFGDIPHLNVYETLELGRRSINGKINKDDKNAIFEMINELNINDWLNRSLSSLSGGERQKVMIAVALLQEPKLLLLDEPISHLDPKNQSQMLHFIKHQTIKKNIITLIVLHDMHHALHYAHNILMLKDGKLLKKIKPNEANSQYMSELFDIPVTLHKIDGHTFLYYGHIHGDKSIYSHHTH